MVCWKGRGNRSECPWVGGAREFGDDLQGAIEAVAEALGEGVVGSAAGQVGGVVAGVALAEAQRECRRGEHEHDGQPREQRWPGMTGHERSPAWPECAAGRGVRAPPASGDSLAEAREQDREHGQRREHGEGHGEGGGQRGGVEEADAEYEHAEEGGDDRHPGEQDRPPCGLHRGRDRGWEVVSGAMALAEARDDEQGIVDPHSEAEERAELGREVGRVQEPRPEADQAQSGPEAEQCGDDRQAHGQGRSEGDQQDDHGGEQADRRGRAERRAGGGLDRPAAEIDLQIARSRCRGDGDHAVDRGLGQGVGALVEGHGGKGGSAGGRDAARAGRRERADDAGHVRQARDACEHGGYVGSDRGIADAPVAGVEDDLVGVAGLCREVAAQQVGRALGVGAGQREIVDVVGMGRLRSGHGDDERGQPAADDDPAMACRPSSQSPHDAHRGDPRPGSAITHRAAEKRIR